MSYFKKIGNSISVKSKELVRNAKAVSEANSLNNIVKAEQQKIDSNYKMMGKIYFEKFSEGPSEDFEEYVAAIKASMERINEVNDEIAKIRKRNCCPNCGAKFRADALFCSRCGSRVREEVPEEEIYKCPDCGNVLVKDAAFCDSCGAKINHDEQSETEVSEQTADAVPEPERAEAEIPEKKIEEQPVQAETENNIRKVCPSCGTEQDDDSEYCIDCGAKL